MDSVNGSDWPDDALSNERIFMPVKHELSDRWAKKYGENRKLEKSILHFDAHQNPRIWPTNKMKRSSNVTKYDELSISTLKTLGIMGKKENRDRLKIFSLFFKISTLFSLIKITPKGRKPSPNTQVLELQYSGYEMQFIVKRYLHFWQFYDILKIIFENLSLIMGHPDMIIRGLHDRWIEFMQQKFPKMSYFSVPGQFSNF